MQRCLHTRHKRACAHFIASGEYGRRMCSLATGINKFVLVLLLVTYQLLSGVPDTKPILGTASLGTGRPGTEMCGNHKLQRNSIQTLKSYFACYFSENCCIYGQLYIKCTNTHIWQYRSRFSSPSQTYSIKFNGYWRINIL